MTESRRWSTIALAVAVATALVAGFVPLGSSETCDSAGACTFERVSIIGDEGIAMLLILLAPALVALVPVVLPFQWLRIATGVLLPLMMLLAMASVGMFLLPTMVIAWVAVAQNSAAPDSAAQPPPPRPAS